MLRKFCLAKFRCKSLRSLASTPRPPKDPPDEGYKPMCVQHDDFEVAEFVRPEAFRQFTASDEVLGPGAGHNKQYKNAQYFGYHRFSFVELQSQAIELRNERRIAGGVQVDMGPDEDDQCPVDTLEVIKQQELECEKALKKQLKDDEITKLQAWCDAIEKKQAEMQKLKSGDKELKVRCEEMEKKQQELIKKGKTLKDKDEIEMHKSLEKKVGDILKECKDKMKKTSAVKEKPKDEEQKKPTEPKSKDKDKK